MMPNDAPLLSRREALAGGAAALAILAAGTLPAEPRPAEPPPAEPLPAEPLRRRPRIAAAVTEYRTHSHAQNIVDRFLEGFGWETRHHRPDVDVVSLCVDQQPAGDLSRERTMRHQQLKIYPTIAEALTLGGDRLAVDGVLLIGEHGNYPRNERGQTLYPRYEFFRQIVEVFERSGRSVPVFNDKHLSWNWDWAKEMVGVSRSLGFPLMAGSSLPVTWRMPASEMPWEAEIEEVFCIGPGKPDSYDFHLLEAVQCLAERRRGGETGVRRIQGLRGDKVWEAMRAGSWQAGGWDPALLEACLCRSILLMPARETFCHIYPEAGEIPRLVADPVAYRYEYADGLKATVFLADGLVGDITFAARLKGHDEPFSLAFYLGAGHEQQPNFFNPLVRHIEQMFLTGRVPYPIERTLLTTGLTAAGVESTWRGGGWLDTPHLALEYRVAPESTFRKT